MTKIVFFLIFNLLFLSNCLANEAYVGASFGDSNTSLNGYNSPTGFKAYLGVHINDRFGVEIGFINLGTFKRSAGSLKVDGTEISAVGFIPVGSDGNIFGKLGLFSWNSEYSNGANVDGTDFTLGLGVQFPIRDAILVRIEYQEFRDINDNNDDFTLLSVGLALSF